MLSRHSWSLALLVAGAVSFSTFVACGPAKSKCTAATCFGCCDADGECQGGASQLACGSGGAACQACSFGSLCQLGSCTAGTGGGSGSGGGGGSTGGGGGSTGGGGGSTGGGGGSTGGGGGSTGGGGGGSTGGGGGSVGGGGGSVGGGGGSTGGGGGSTGGGGGSTGGGGGSTGGGGGSLAGDTCATAQTITFTNGTASVTGTTSGYTNNLTASCANAGQPDRFYIFSLTQPTELEFTLVSSGFQPALSLHPWSSGSCGSEYGCLMADGVGVTLTQSVPMPAGTFAVAIDSASSGGGAFTLSARQVTSTPDAGMATTLSNGIPVTISGAGLSETLFTFTVPSTATTLNVSTTGGSGDVDLYLRRSTPPDLSTSAYDYDSAASGNDELITVSPSPAGTWYLTAYGYGSGYTGATLMVSW
jgi:hypothetical protein